MWVSMPVGFRQGLLDDAARPNWDGSGPRPLRWTAWYPAADDAVEQELFPEQRGSAWFAFGPAARDAAVNQCRKRYPIVLLSHGTGGTVMNLDWLAEQGLERLPDFLTALAIGLMIGLERERNPTAKGGHAGTTAFLRSTRISR